MSDKDKAQREREIALASQMDAIKKKITRGRVLSIALSAMMGALTLWMLLHK